MDKNAIKKYAVWARRELVSRVSQKALQYGITEKNMVDAGADSVNGHLLTSVEKKQRQALIAKIKKENYGQVMEEVAYTWFNRFIALRFMEVNGYLPTHVRVFTDANNAFKPQILTEAIHLEMDGLDMDKVYALKTANQTDELFKYLIITQCNALSAILPGMFQKIEDYTELLFPDNLLREGSVIEQMIAMIPEEDWKDEVQIIGWLYQYYNTEPKQAVFDGLKKNIKITKEKIPAATQLFTPDWIVRYMVENSLGRLWIEGHPNDELKSTWKYYLDEAKQEPEVQAQLEKIREEYKALTPEQIKFIDPCMGSGHILVYAFDVLMQIYESEGYNPRDAAKLILEKNLYGLDIDRRAYQLAYFSLMMKARQYNRRIFDAGVKPQVYHPAGFPDGEEYGSLVKVDTLEDKPQEKGIGEQIEFDDNYERDLRVWNFKRLLAQKYDVVVTNPPYIGAKTGMSDTMRSFLQLHYPEHKGDTFAAFVKRVADMSNSTAYFSLIIPESWLSLSSFESLRSGLIQTNRITNLLHLGAGAFDSGFGTAAFVAGKMYVKTYLGAYVQLTQFAESNDKKNELLTNPQKNTFHAHQEDFTQIDGTPISYWVSQKIYSGFNTFPTLDSIADARQGLTTCDNNRFLRLWHEVVIDDVCTHYNLNTDVSENHKTWYPFCKGGEPRKWYGNNEFVVNWRDDGRELKAFIAKKYVNYTRHAKSIAFYFRHGLTWSAIAKDFAVRVYPDGFIFADKGQAVFTKDKDYYYLCGLLNSKYTAKVLSVLSPTLDFNCGYIKRIPVAKIKDTTLIEHLVKSCIELCVLDWDSFETSWDFKRHPLIQFRVPAAAWGDEKPKFTIQAAYIGVKAFFSANFETLKRNEEELNRIFIDIYGLQDELTPEEDDKDVTVHYIADTKEDAPEGMRNSPYLLTKQDVIKSLIPYAVGCMFGRYSLDKEGLIFAGGNFDEVYWKFLGQAPCDKDGSLPYGSGYAGISLAKYHYPYFRDGDDISTATKLTYSPDVDNCIPICDDDYFEDDILGRFVKFIEVVYGKEALEENLKFIADALGGKGSPREVIRNYFLNDFYADHCKIYQKRPIYWLFDSGKKNGFKALIYMHRYQPDTLARMRTDYVHEQQARYRTAIADVEQRMNGASGSERVKLNKQLAKLQGQATEIREYEEKIHHLADQMISIDLDDGVKHNYAIFKDVLAPIK